MFWIYQANQRAKIKNRPITSIRMDGLEIIDTVSGNTVCCVIKTKPGCICNISDVTLTVESTKKLIDFLEECVIKYNQ